MKAAWLLVCAVWACGGQIDAVHDGGGDAGQKDAPAKQDVVAVPDVVDSGPIGIGGVNLSGDGPAYQTEVQIAVAADGTIGIMWTEISPTPPYVSMGYRFSIDDGKTFSPVQHITLPAGLYPGDPALNVDANGNFYAGLLGIHYSAQTVDYSRVFAAKSPQGALKFGTPVEVSAPGNTTALFDHPKIFVTSKGTILVGYADFPSLQGVSGTGVVSSSVDGTTWTQTEVIGQPEAQFANLFWFCEGASSVYLTFLEASTTDYFVGVRTTANDGASWSSASVPVSLSGEMLAGLDPECVASGNDVWVMYTTTKKQAMDETTLDLANAIYVAHSGDGGGTFDATRGQALDTAASQLAVLPNLTRESSGRLDVSYIAGDADGDTSGSLRYDTMIGMKATPTVLVDGPILFTSSRTSQTWLGDYFGSAVHAGALYLAYPRNDSGLSHIYFAKAPLP